MKIAIHVLELELSSLYRRLQKNIAYSEMPNTDNEKKEIEASIAELNSAIVILKNGKI